MIADILCRSSISLDDSAKELIAMSRSLFDP